MSAEPRVIPEEPRLFLSQRNSVLSLSLSLSSETLRVSAEPDERDCRAIFRPSGKTAPRRCESRIPFRAT